MKVSSTGQLRIYFSRKEADNIGVKDEDRANVRWADGKIYVTKSDEGNLIRLREGMFQIFFTPTKVIGFPKGYWVRNATNVAWTTNGKGLIEIKMPDSEMPLQPMPAKNEAKSFMDNHADPDIKAAWVLFCDEVVKTKKRGVEIRIIEDASLPSGYVLQVKDGWQTI